MARALVQPRRDEETPDVEAGSSLLELPLLGSSRAGRKATIASGIVLGVVVLVSALGPVLVKPGPFAIDGAPLVPPFHSAHLLFGTDNVGHSILTGLVYGGAPMLEVGAAAAAIMVAIGVTIGSIAGYFGGWIDSVISRVIEVVMVIPVILFAIVVLSMVRPTGFNLALVIGLVSWPATARVARGEFLRFKESEFVRSAKVGGASTLRIMYREILPNAAPPLIVMGGLAVAVAMLFQAGISFLGLGNSNQMSWGLMMGQNQNAILEAWWPSALPGLAIFVTVLSVNVFAGGIVDLLDPRAHRK